ncbi:MAG: right-handed parallel beta-helix repeat-containing protein [Actinomycetota bacterium]
MRAAAAILVLLAARLPIWEARLSAPSTPRASRSRPAGFGVRGDIREVNGFNHYVGMEAFSAADAPEISWRIPAIVLASIAVVVAIVLPRRHPLARLARSGLAGADRSAGRRAVAAAPVRAGGERRRPDPPGAVHAARIGPTHVLNFTTWAFPGGAVWCLLGAAVLISFGPGLPAGPRALGDAPDLRGRRDRGAVKRAATCGVAAFALAAVVVGLWAMADRDGGPTRTGAMEHDHAGMADMGGGMYAGPDGRMVMPADHLRSMIESTPAGGVLRVPAADYLGSIVVDRPITLDGRGTAVIDGLGEGSVIHVTSPDVTIRGLTVRGSARGPVGSPSAILLEGADRTRVEDVRIEGSYLGITVRRSPGVVIEGARIRGHGVVVGELHAVEGDDDDHGTAHTAGARDEAVVRGDGIWLWNTTDVTVRDSTISGVRDGIYLSYGIRPRLAGNTIEESRYAIHDMYAEDLSITGNTLRGNLSGIVLMYGGPVAVSGNTIVESGSPATGFGVLVKDAGDVTLADNVIADNRVGLHLDDAGRTAGAPTRVTGNTIAMNRLGVLLYPSADSSFSGNGFVENSTQVSIGGKGSTQVRWAIDGIGNHWSDYPGFDAGGDGVGDVPYVATGRLSELLAEVPVLEALASGPAFRLLATVSDRWASDGAPPAVEDPAPLLASRGPAPGAAGPSGRAWLAVVGMVMLGASGWSLLRSRGRVRAGGHG